MNVFKKKFPVSLKKISCIAIMSCIMLSFCACESASSSTVGYNRSDLLSSISAESDSGADSTNTSDNVSGNEVEKRISFVAAGDNIIHESVFTDAMAKATEAVSVGTYSGKYYFDDMYDGIKDIIQKADIAYVNQEGPVAGDALGVHGYPTFNAPEEIGDVLINIGFDIVNLANNHMLDMDTSTRPGYLKTIEYWNTKPVMTIGAHIDEDDFNTIRVYEEKGVKIAFLSYTYGVNSGTSISSASPNLVVPYIDDATITRQIAEAKEISDLVFVSMHWGTDTAGSSFNNYPTDEQRRLAQLIADCGADAIIGMHPHVVQPIEWVTGVSGNQTLVAYSLGNLLSTMLNSYNLVGGILSFDIVINESSKPSIENVIFNPVMCHYEADSSVLDSQSLATRFNVKLYMMEDYTEELAKSHGSQLYGKFDLYTLYRYITDTVSGEFLPSYLK